MYEVLGRQPSSCLSSLSFLEPVGRHPLLQPLPEGEALWEPQLPSGFSVPTVHPTWDKSLSSGPSVGARIWSLGSPSSADVLVLLDITSQASSPRFRFSPDFCPVWMSLAFSCPIRHHCSALRLEATDGPEAYRQGAPSCALAWGHLQRRRGTQKSCPPILWPTEPSSTVRAFRTGPGWSAPQLTGLGPKPHAKHAQRPLFLNEEHGGPWENGRLVQA